MDQTMKGSKVISDPAKTLDLAFTFLVVVSSSCMFQSLWQYFSHLPISVIFSGHNYIQVYTYDI